MSTAESGLRLTRQVSRMHEPDYIATRYLRSRLGPAHPETTVPS